MTKGEFVKAIPSDRFKIIGLSREVSVSCRQCSEEYPGTRPLRTWYWSAVEIADADTICRHFADHMLWHDDHPGESYDDFESARLKRIGEKASREAMQMLNKFFRFR